MDAGPMIDGGGRDSSIGDAPPLRDAPVDTADIDVGLRCTPTRAEYACMADSIVPSGEAFVLPMGIRACSCCPNGECHVRVRDDRTLEITTTLCDIDCDCEGCNDAQIACEVPPLGEGTWRVMVNGEAAMELRADRPRPGVAEPRCVEHAQIDFCAPGRPGLAISGELNVDSICADVTVSGAYEVVVVDNCWGCGQLDGPCETTLFPSDDPDAPGGVIQVVSYTSDTECDVDCPDVCIRHERRCKLPPLVPGGVYAIDYGAGDRALELIADGRGTCAP
jgi:hypothetical protein